MLRQRLFILKHNECEQPSLEMSATNATIVVVICHGSYHTPEPYQPFLTALKAQGIEAYCPQLPSSDLRLMNVGEISNPDYDRDPPPNGYPQPADDAKVLNKLLSQLITDSGKHVLLVGHSAGAFTATMVAIPELQAKPRKVKGALGGIIGLFYESGFMIPVGESVHSFFQPKDGSEAVIPPYCQFHKHGFSGPRVYERRCQVPMTVLDNDAYTALPCAYLVTEDDLALPSAYQDAMVAIQSQRPGVDMTVFRCPAGHSPHLTWTEGLVERVRDFGLKVLG
ncbi:MAG: hypothetical protein Q9175_008320 [Cornicularia normoerica]